MKTKLTYDEFFSKKRIFGQGICDVEPLFLHSGRCPST